MKHSYLKITCLCALLLVFLSNIQAESTSYSTNDTKSPNSPTQTLLPDSNGLQAAHYRQGRVIVKFREGTQNSRKLVLRNRFKASLVKTLSIVNAEVWQVENVDSVISLQQHHAYSEIEYMAPNHAIPLNNVSNNLKRTPKIKPNDPKFNQQWALAKIGATKAWDFVTGNPVICAVIDTGVDYTHPDLATNMWTNPHEIPNNGIDDDDNGYVDDVYGYDFPNNDGDPMDDHYHGTAIAGIIAAVGNNNTGIVGINWSAKIMALKAIGVKDTSSLINAEDAIIVTGSTSLHVADAIAAIEYAVQMGAKVINASWHLTEINDEGKNLLYDAIKKAQNEGILLITAAGNISEDIDSSLQYPASYELENIISVAATDQNDKLATFDFQIGSNYGFRSVDLGAPGLSIYTTMPPDYLPPEEKSEYFPLFKGTSAATSYVSGAVTLLWSASPNLTAIEVKQQIMASVDKIPALEKKTVTGGRLNMYKAITGLQPVKPVADIFPVVGVAPLTVTAKANSSGIVTSYNWILSDGRSISGQNTTFTFNSPGTYTVILIVIDNSGAIATASPQSIIVTEQKPKQHISISPTNHIFPETLPDTLFLNQKSRRKSLPNHTLKGEYWPQRVIVKFREGIQRNRKRSLRNRTNATLIKTLPFINAELWQVEDVKAFIVAQPYRTSSDIEYIEPDYMIRAKTIKSEDSVSEDSVSENSVDSVSVSKWWGANKINDDMITVKPKYSVVCGVMDSGVDYNHPDLASKMWKNFDEIPNSN